MDIATYLIKFPKIIMYKLNSKFDIELHKQTFIDYLEVMIDERGHVEYAIPSHQEFLIKKGMEKHHCSRDDYFKLCPEDYYARYTEWLTSDTGWIAVWNLDYVGKPNSAQLETLAELKEAGLYNGSLEKK